MAMAASYVNAIANSGAALITHIGLVNGSGVELSGGSYARQAVTWTTAPASGVGTVRPNADLNFNVPAGGVVAGWRGYTASSAGTNHGGADLTSETYTNAGTYTLLAASTGITHTAV